MKKLIFLAVLSFCFGTGSAQNTINSLKLVIDKTKHIAISTSAASVDIEGYDGDELIIEAVTNKVANNVPEEATGMTKMPFANRPKEDNTIGYKLSPPANNLFQVNITTKCKYLHFKVPNHLFLFSVNIFNQLSDGYLSIKNIESPFIIDGYVQTIKISDVAGPFKITGQANKVLLNNILWNKNAAWPFTSGDYGSPYMIRIKANIDISIPANLQASILLNSGYGQIYSDLPQFIKAKKDPSIYAFPFNGGGLSISANSNGGSIYIREQK